MFNAVKGDGNPCRPMAADRRRRPGPREALTWHTATLSMQTDRVSNRFFARMPQRRRQSTKRGCISVAIVNDLAVRSPHIVHASAGDVSSACHAMSSGRVRFGALKSWRQL